MEWKNKIIEYLIANGPKLLGAALIIFAGLLVGRWIARGILRWLGRRDMEPPVRMLITRVARILIVGFAAVIALGTMGINIMALVTGIGVLGVAASLAMQGVLTNLVAGLLIIFTKPFRVGQYINIAGEYGQVDLIELFNTTLLHPDRSRVVIPNRKIAGEILHNYGNTRQLDLAVGVAYDTDLPRALETVQQVLLTNPRVLKEIAPVIGVSALGDSAVTLAVKPWVAVADYVPAQAELYRAILEQFRAQRIEIPFPQREVHVISQKAA